MPTAHIGHDTYLSLLNGLRVHHRGTSAWESALLNIEMVVIQCLQYLYND